MMNAIYNRQLFRVIEDVWTGAVLEEMRTRTRIFVDYADPLLVVDPTDREYEAARDGCFHHENEWGLHVCCQTFSASSDLERAT